MALLIVRAIANQSKILWGTQAEPRHPFGRRGGLRRCGAAVPPRPVPVSLFISGPRADILVPMSAGGRLGAWAPGRSLPNWSAI
ncbi:MAG: hypothetical protein AUK55_03900 [Syntrophobacteraceae bacterium CG2_30_61_12]|nr:MAG: hypothetical protein AUK55_03900 [Syntrophobacteraceae bacterium CG2_30_61_12]